MFKMNTNDHMFEEFDKYHNIRGWKVERRFKSIFVGISNVTLLM